jgi:beta-glucosidase-like glycosyl hydrolase
VRLYIESVLVGTIPLSIYITRDAGPVAASLAEIQPYLYTKVFVSYSHKDGKIIDRITAAAATLGPTFIRDQVHLRSGETWDEQLLELIDQSDVFQLYWSANASVSKYVEQEWQQPIALAASFDPALVEEIMTAVAKETRARGAHHTLAPVIDVMRDPRWGRAEETYGEDTYLVSRMGVAAVRGLQGRASKGDGKTPGKIDANHVMATLKHFAVHGQPEAGMNVGPGNYSERMIREVFLPPFAAAIKEAGARALMPAYVEIDGVPAHGNKAFLQDILRKEWGFDGLVVSDYFAIEQLKSLHSVVDSDAAAARLAFESGVDLELPDPKLYPLLAAQVKSKAIPMALIDKAVGRVLKAKFELGLFEQPYVDEGRVALHTRTGDGAPGPVRRRTASPTDGRRAALAAGGRAGPAAHPRRHRRPCQRASPRSGPPRIGCHAGPRAGGWHPAPDRRPDHGPDRLTWAARNATS